MRVLPTIGLLCAVALVVPNLAAAEGGSLPLTFRASPDNVKSVQRGARDFMNYCAGCHTLKYLRFSRLGDDVGISKEMLQKNLMFVQGQKTTSHITNAMPSAEGKAFFGKAPPDLTLEAGFRSPKWIYNYLHGFYLDPERPTGVNNTLIKNVAMPDVIWSLQGWQKQVKGKDGDPRLELVSQGSMTPDQFDAFVADLTNFLAYAATPEHHLRATIGPFVLLYLVILGGFCYLVKRAFWKDVHH